VAVLPKGEMLVGSKDLFLLLFDGIFQLHSSSVEW
jgi:hypothetical protein